MKNLNQLSNIMSFAVFFLVIIPIVAQKNLTPQDIQVGKPFPQTILSNLYDYPVNEIDTRLLKGKHFILFFYDRFCGGAFKYLSQMDKLAKEYSGQVDIFVVAGRRKPSIVDYKPEEEIDTLKTLYQKAKKYQDLQLPITYDLDLFQNVVTGGVPYLILVDDKGIIKAITADLNSEKMEAFLKGESFSFFNYSEKAREVENGRLDKYDYGKPFLVDNNGGHSGDFQFRSLITPYIDEMPKAPILPSRIERYDDFNKLEGAGSLYNLYKLAYFGYTVNIETEYYDNNYPEILLEVKDTIPFISYRFERPVKNLWWYSLVVPERLRGKESLKRIMKNDLYDYFGYEVRLEKKVMPYWKITISEKNKRKLQTKGDASESNQWFDRTDYWFVGAGAKNIPIDNYLGMMFSLVYPTMSGGMPILDETGIEGNIDVPYTDADLSNFYSIKSALEQNGFTIEKSSKEFNVLIIGDPAADLAPMN